MSESVKMLRWRRDESVVIETFPIDQLAKRIKQQFKRREAAAAYIGDTQVGSVVKDEETQRWTWWHELSGDDEADAEREWLLDSVAAERVTRRGL